MFSEEACLTTSGGRSKDKKKSIFSVQDVLPAVINSISRRDIQEQISLEKLWQETLGVEADHAVIVGFKDGCIFIHVDSQARLFKMRMNKAGLLTKLKTQRKDITNISFKIGRIT